MWCLYLKNQSGVILDKKEMTPDLHDLWVGMKDKVIFPNMTKTDFVVVTRGEHSVGSKPGF